MRVADALVAWRARTGQSEATDRGLAFRVRLGPLAIPIPNPGQLHWHDLHHLVLGYGTDLEGEMEISAYELRTVPRTLIVFLLCIAGVAAGLVLAPRRTLAAWRRARRCRNLYGAGLRYDDVIGWRMEELAAWMAPPITLARQSTGWRRRRGRDLQDSR
jgi:hypothetical protein